MRDEDKRSGMAGAFLMTLLISNHYATWNDGSRRLKNRAPEKCPTWIGLRAFQMDLTRT